MFVVFFGIDVYYFFIRVVVYSYKFVLIGYESVKREAVLSFLKFFLEFFLIGVEISLLILMSMFIVDIILVVFLRVVL